jgi:hypothetical protein
MRWMQMVKVPAISPGRAAPPGPQAKEVRTRGPSGDGTASLGLNRSLSFRRFPRRWNPTFFAFLSRVPPAVEPYLFRYPFAGSPAVEPYLFHNRIRMSEIRCLSAPRNSYIANSRGWLPLGPSLRCRLMKWPDGPGHDRGFVENFVPCRYAKGTGLYLVPFLISFWLSCSTRWNRLSERRPGGRMRRPLFHLLYDTPKGRAFIWFPS